MVLGVFLGANFYHMVTKKNQWDSYEEFCEMNMPKLKIFKEGFYLLKLLYLDNIFKQVIEIQHD
jgi:hypothetical protein